MNFQPLAIALGMIGGFLFGFYLGARWKAERLNAKRIDSLGAFVLGELERWDSISIPRVPEVSNREALWAIELCFPLAEVQRCATFGWPLEPDRHDAMLAKARIDFGGLPALRRKAVVFSPERRGFLVTYYSAVDRGT